MYESYFGLKQKAFNLTPDPDFLYLNERTKDAFDEILYGIERRDGFAVIVGDVGTGKTTLSCALLQRLEGSKNIRTVLIQNPMLPEVDILKSIVQDLGINPVASWSDSGEGWHRELTKKELIDVLNTYLAERARENIFTVLIVDESQNLSLEILEQLRLLSNLETTKKKLLQIIFLGQLEFDRKLAALRQLDQRISFRFETKELSREDTARYIQHRLQVAGATHAIRFGRGALDAIYLHSKGYPRLINMVCDRSLREAFRSKSTTITRQIVNGAVVGLARKEVLLRNARLQQMQKVAALLLLPLVAVLAGLLWWAVRPAPTPAAAPKPATPAVEEKVIPSQQKEPEAHPVAPQGPRLKQEAPHAPASAASLKPVDYVLQVYSFRTMGRAEESAGDLKGMSFPSFVVHQPGMEDEGWYVVYVGPFGDLETARRAGTGLQAATGTTPVLRERISGDPEGTALMR
jgi:general secretion pathway protein A